MPVGTDYTSDSQGRAKLTLTVNATSNGANWSVAVSDGSTNYGGYAYSAGSWSVTVAGQSVLSESGKSYDFGSGVIASPYFPKTKTGSVTGLSPGTYTASATFSGDGTTVGTASTSVSFTVAAPPATTYYYQFFPNGGNGSFSSSSTTATSITAPSPGTRAGFTFTGWYWGASDYSTTNGPFLTGATMPTTAMSTSSGSETRIFAFWSQDSAPTTYSYSYNSDGGSNTPSGASGLSAGYSIPGGLGSPGTRSGYTFNGWFSSATSQVLGVGAAYTVNANTTFTAQWTPVGGGETYPPAWTDSTLAAFVAGKAYSDSVTATNMNYSGVYSVSSGSLPSGISLNASTGALTGTVTSATDYSFTITATNSYSSVPQAFSGSITGALKVYSEGQWGKKIARVYSNGEWKPATVNIYSNGSWSPAS